MNLEQIIKSPVTIESEVYCANVIPGERTLSFSFIAKIDGDTCDYNLLIFPRFATRLM